MRRSNLAGEISGKSKMVYDVLTLFGNPCIAFPPMNTLNTIYALASHTIRLGETDWERHPGGVKAKGGGRRAEEWIRPDDMRLFNNIRSHING